MARSILIKPGTVFGDLTVLERVGKDARNNYLWKCKCSCGNETTLKTTYLTSKKSAVKSCGCRRGTTRTDMIGKTFKTLTVIGIDHITKGYVACFKCRCTCGNIVVSSKRRLLQRTADYCKACHLKWYGELPSTYWFSILANAKNRNRKVLITPEEAWSLFERQEKCCALSGIPLVFHKRINEQTASLDRIDSEKDYTLENVQWIHKKLNLMKNHFPQDEFVLWCTRVGDHCGTV